MMPSSAATTSTTISVTRAPRARIKVKASWPGVSINVTFFPCPYNLIGADALRNATRFVGSHVGLAQRIQKRGLAVVDVAHHGDHRSSWSQVLRAIRLFDFLQNFFLVTHNGRFRAKAASDIHRCRAVEGLIDGGENPFVQQAA